MSAPLGRAPSLTARSSFRKTEGKSSGLTGLKRKRAAWKARKSSLPQAIGLTYCAFFHLRIDTPPRIRYNKEAVRGVAHPVERVVWDHEARSSSLRTSTSGIPPRAIRALTFVDARTFLPARERYLFVWPSQIFGWDLASGLSFSRFSFILKAGTCAGTKCPREITLENPGANPEGTSAECKER